MSSLLPERKSKSFFFFLHRSETNIQIQDCMIAINRVECSDTAQAAQILEISQFCGGITIDFPIIVLFKYSFPSAERKYTAVWSDITSLLMATKPQNK